MSKLIVYAIGLQHDKYFIGSTNNISKTLYNIFSDRHKLDPLFKPLLVHKPLYVDQIYYDCSETDENKYVLDYVVKYGINNVYGNRIDSHLCNSINSNKS